MIDLVEDDKLSIDNHPVLHEYRDIFPEEIPGLPPKRDIDFSMELVPRVMLVSIVPYRMSTHLKMQLKEMLDKGYIGPSVSPWGELILFVKKKDGTLMS